MNRQLPFLITALLIALPASAEWDIWLVPESRTFDPGDRFNITYGISGKGALNPQEVKFTIYAEKDTQLELAEKANKQYQIITSFLKKDTSFGIFSEPAEGIPLGENQDLALRVEHSTPFAKLWVIPESPGDKTLLFVLTYKGPSGEWRTQSRELDYHVSTWYQRNESWIQTIAVIAAILGIWVILFQNRRRNRG